MPSMPRVRVKLPIDIQVTDEQAAAIESGARLVRNVLSSGVADEAKELLGHLAKMRRSRRAAR
jgi:hypothetical protein